jgi:hypothetical protein
MSKLSFNMYLDKKTKVAKEIHWMPERCRRNIPVSKGNRGNGLL